jgi:hypothetical protein
MRAPMDIGENSSSSTIRNAILDMDKYGQYRNLEDFKGLFLVNMLQTAVSSSPSAQGVIF